MDSINEKHSIENEEICLNYDLNDLENKIDEK